MPTEDSYYTKEYYDKNIIDEAYDKLFSHLNLPGTQNVSESIKELILDFNDATEKQNRVNDIVYTFGKMYNENFENVKKILNNEISNVKNEINSKNTSDAQYQKLLSKLLKLENKIANLDRFSALKYTGIKNFIKDTLHKHYLKYAQAYNEYLDYENEQDIFTDFDIEFYEDIFNIEKKAVNDKYGINEESFAKVSEEERNVEVINNIIQKGKAYKKVIKHFTLLFNEASAFIKNDYGIDITLSGNISDVIEKITEDSTDMEGEQSDLDFDTLGEEKQTEKESWQVEAMSTSSFSQTNPDVLEMCRNIPKRKNGEIIRDDLGIPQYYSPEYIKTVLIEVAENAVDIEQFDELLNSNKNKYPFLDDLLEKLNDDLRLGKKGKALWTKTWCDVNLDTLKFMTIDVDFFDGTVKTIHLSESEGVYSLIRKWADNQIGYVVLSNNSVYTKYGTIDENNLRLNLNTLDILKSSVTDNASFGKNASEQLIKNEDTIKKFKSEFSDADEVLRNIRIRNFSNNVEEKKKATEYISSKRNNINKFLKDNNLNGGAESNLTSLNDVVNLAVDVMYSIGAEVDKNDIVRAIRNDKKYLNSLVSNLYTILSGLNNSTSIDDIDSKRLINSYGKAFNEIAYPIAKVSEDVVEHSVRVGNKTRYAHQQLSELGYFIKNIKNEDENRRNKFFNDEFNSFFFLKWNPETGKYEYRNQLLKNLYENKSSRDVFDRLIPLDFDGSEYKDWDDATRWRVMYETYWSRDIKHNGTGPVYFALPTLSNLQHTEFIQFERFNVEDGLVDVVMQEYDRIKIVKERKKNKNVELENFDKRGDKFLWFPELNDLRFTIEEGNENTYKVFASADTNGMTFEEVIDFLKDKNIQSENVIKSVMGSVMENLYSKQLKFLIDNDMVTEGNKFNLPVMSDKPNWDKDIRDFFYQSTFARIQIEQLFITDRAFYKNPQDMTKRIKEIISSTKRMQTNPEYSAFGYAKETRSTIILKDFITPSAYINELMKVIKNNPLLSESQKDAIFSIFSNVNTTDAQGIINIDSLACILDMQGLWNEELETAKNKLKSGRWNYDDLKSIVTYLQTLKPHNFTNIFVDSNTLIDDSNGKQKAILRVPFQNKNSEMVMLGVFAALADNPVYGNNSKIFKVLDKFMTKNNIDAIQFESTTKHGSHGKIQLNYKGLDFNKTEGNVKYADYEIEFLDGSKHTYRINSINGKKQKIDNKDYYPLAGLLSELYVDNKISYEQYSEIFSDNLSEDKLEKYLESFVSTEKRSSFVYDTPYNKYGIITSTPEHGIDRRQLIGTQFMTFIPANMSNITTIDVNGTKFTTEQFKKLYNLVYVSQLYNSFSELKEDFQNIEMFQKLLLDELKGSIYDTPSMRRALELITVETANGPVKTFNIPLYERSQALRIENFVNSIIRNRITKRKAKGGSYLQATSYLLENRPEIVFMDKKGNEVSFSRFSKNKRFSGLSNIQKRALYNDYINSNELTVKHYEIFVPCYDTKLFDDCVVENNKNVYLDANKLPNELREGVAYRVPTEGFYSMCPVFIKQFLPQHQGSAIMLPLEITAITGDDNDGDKFYVLFNDNEKVIVDTNSVFNFAENNISNFSSLSNVDKNYVIKTAINYVVKNEPYIESSSDELNDILSAVIEELNENFDFYKLPDDKIHYEKVSFTWGHTLKRDNNESDEDYNFRCICDAVETAPASALNNMFIDLSRSRLQEPTTASRMLTPGEPIEAKKIASINSILQSIPLNELNEPVFPSGLSIENIYKKSLDELESYEENITKENTASITPLDDISSASAIVSGQDVISISAVNNTSHAKNSYFEFELSENSRFTFNGTQATTFDSELNKYEKYIMDYIANILDVSVDNVKNMVLGKLGITKRNLPILYAMVRSGIPLFDSISFIKQPIFKEIEKYCNDNNIFRITDNVVYNFKKKLHEENSKLYDLPSSTELSRLAFYEQDGKTQKYSFPLSDLLKCEIQEKTFGKYIGNDENIRENKDAVDIYTFLKVQQNVLMLLDNKIMPIVMDMELVSNATRSDTSSGGNHGSNAHIISQQYKIEKIWTNDLKALVPKKNILERIDYESDTLFEDVANSSNPYVQASYTFGIGATEYFLKDYFPEYNTFLTGKRGIIDKLKSVSTISHDSDRDFSERTVKNIINSFYTYLLTDCDVFKKGLTLGGQELNSYEEMADYYLNKFTDDFMEWKKKNPSVTKNQLLNRISRQGAWKKKMIATLDFRNSANVNLMRRQYEADFESLSVTSDPKYFNIAHHLVMYNFFRSGFGFSPNGFASFQNDVVLTNESGGELINYMRNLPEKARNTDIGPFIGQYIEHNLDNYEFAKQLKFKNDKLDKLFVHGKPLSEFTVNLVDENSIFRKSYDKELKMIIPHNYIRIQKDKSFYYYKLNRFEDNNATYQIINPKGIDYYAQEFRYGADPESYKTVLKEVTFEEKIRRIEDDKNRMAKEHGLTYEPLKDPVIERLKSLSAPAETKNITSQQITESDTKVDEENPNTELCGTNIKHQVSNNFKKVDLDELNNL